MHAASIELAAFSERSLGALAYMIIFGSVPAFACYSYLLKHVRAEAVATHSSSTRPSLMKAAFA